MDSDVLNGFSARETRITLIVAVVTSSVSMCCSVVAVYWFLRMKKSFRHDLIMILLASDVFRTLWFLTYPAMVLSQGVITSSSKFCEASGFLLALSTEATDYAILAIAIHTALFIFRAPKRIGKGGLYDYRRVVFVLWFAIPTLFAGLAFINQRNGYVSTGTFCYLPIRPLWDRLALAWVPRYIIFFFISVIYISIYVYVKIKFGHFRALGESSPATSLDFVSTRVASSMDGAEENIGTLLPSSNPLPVPALQTHGLITETRLPPPTPELQTHGLTAASEETTTNLESHADSSPRPSNFTAPKPPFNNRRPPKLQKNGLISESEDNQSLSNTDSPGQNSAAKSGSGSEGPRKQSTASGGVDDGTTRNNSVGVSNPEPENSRKQSAGSKRADCGATRKHSVLDAHPGQKVSADSSMQQGPHGQDPGSRRSSSNPPGRSSLRGSRAAEVGSPRNSSLPRSDPEPAPRVQLQGTGAIEEGQEANCNAILDATRSRIRRQLRFLFVYPFVYLLVWLLPFVAHCLNYTDRFARHPVFALNVANIVILSLRGAIDACVFCWKEKPWRRIPKQRRRPRNFNEVDRWEKVIPYLEGAIPHSWSKLVAWLRKKRDDWISRRSSGTTQVGWIDGNGGNESTELQTNKQPPIKNWFDETEKVMARMAQTGLDGAADGAADSRERNWAVPNGRRQLHKPPGVGGLGPYRSHEEWQRERSLQMSRGQVDGEELRERLENVAGPSGTRRRYSIGTITIQTVGPADERMRESTETTTQTARLAETRRRISAAFTNQRAGPVDTGRRTSTGITTQTAGAAGNDRRRSTGMTVNMDGFTGAVEGERVVEGEANTAPRDITKSARSI